MDRVVDGSGKLRSPRKDPLQTKDRSNDRRSEVVGRIVEIWIEQSMDCKFDLLGNPISRHFMPSGIEIRNQRVKTGGDLFVKIGFDTRQKHSEGGSGKQIIAAATRFEANASADCPSS